MPINEVQGTAVMHGERGNGKGAMFQKVLKRASILALIGFTRFAGPNGTGYGRRRKDQSAHGSGKSPFKDFCFMSP